MWVLVDEAASLNAINLFDGDLKIAVKFNLIVWFTLASEKQVLTLKFMTSM